METDLKYALLVSCENATCAVPTGQRTLFDGREDELHSEAGWEPGALNLAQAISMAFRTPLVHGEITRLILDLEAPIASMWGKDAEAISAPTRERLAERLRHGYRKTLRTRIGEDLQRHDAVVHVLVHVVSIAPGKVVMRVPESSSISSRIAESWAEGVQQECLHATVVAGGDPGDLIAETQSHFSAGAYAPIRLEVDSGYFLNGQPMRWDAFKKTLIQSLAAILNVKV